MLEVKYNGKWYEVLEVKPASRSNDPKVKEAYRLSEIAWVMDTEIEGKKGKFDGQSNS